MGTSIYRTARYTARPPSANRAARAAWDELARRAALMDPARVIELLWFAPEMEAWNARLNEIGRWNESPYIEMDALEARDRVNNPHKYAANDEPPRAGG